MVNVGTMLGGRYRLDERIAGGGMGEVWRGTDDVLGRTVAVKILLPTLLEDPGFVERFRGEARTMATISHPGVVNVYDYGSDPVAGAYLVMEYVEGDALSRTLGRVGRLTPGRTMALVAQAADALQAAHDKGIVHRDVKPGNLLVRPDGTLVLTDFGIARSAIVGQLTAVGSVLGTASYISPEQAAGAVATPLSDVYALGVVAYQCLAGRRPFEGDNPLEIAMQHVRSQPPPLPRDTPPNVRAIVERAMAKDPSARYPSAAALGQVARRAAAGLAGGGGPGVGPAGAPVSVPPIASQTSPGPLASATAPTVRAPAGAVPAARPPAAGVPATRAMPGYPGAAARTRPVSPAGYARGSALPPTQTPRRPEPPYPAATPPTKGGGSNSRAVLTGVLVGLVALLLIGAGVLAFVLASQHNGGTSPAATDTPTTPATTAAAPPPTDDQPQNTPTTGSADQLVNLHCDQLIGRPYSVVSRILEDANFGVDEDKVDGGGKAGTVLDVTPCQARPGDTIRVEVTTGKNGDDGGNGGGGRGGSGPTTQPTTPNPDQTCGTGGHTGDCSADPQKSH
jgi:serine/threonine-protein kinase